MMWSAPHLAIIHPAIPARSLESFIAYARARPGELSYGSSGIGSSTHLFGEMFKARTGMAATPAPIIARLRAQLDTLLASRDFAERMHQVGVQIQRMRLDEFDAFAKQERLRWAKLIESLKLQIE